MSDFTSYDKPHPFGGAAARNVNERRTSALWNHGKAEYLRGVAAERERIVAWLRERGADNYRKRGIKDSDCFAGLAFADAIERGKHA